MPDATITSTASTFGTISGVFSADQSTISGTISGIVPGTLTGSVGVPGPVGPAGPGVPAGGTAGQYLQKTTTGVDYATDWVTLNLSAYAPIASPLFTGNPRGPTAALGDNDTSLATTAFVQQELLSGTANARNLEVYVRNQSGASIPAGSIVYISGATGNRPLITLSQANNDANSAQTMGFTKTAIANNAFGYVIVRGEVENLDTSALTEGVQLYLSPTTAGTWTTTKPSAPQHLVYVGIVIRAHPTQGVILVAVQNGFEVAELHDVKITTPSNGQVLKYDSAQSLWVNGTDVGGVSWGGITGTISDQTDLQSALDSKYDASNPAGFIDSSALAGYATESWVSSQGYLTTAILDGYALLSGASFSGFCDFINGLSSSGPVTLLDNGYLDASGLDGDSRRRIRFGAGNGGGSWGWGDFGFDGSNLFFGNDENLPETLATRSWVTAGLTFTGKVTGTATATSAAFNIGTVTAAPTTLVNGDIWITDRLSFRNRFGNTITGLTSNQTNTISTSSDVAFILGITQNGNGGGLRVVNNGTGDSFRVEDETPESTPFVISNSGRVGIGVTPDATAALKVDAGGIKFNDGTTQITASVSGLAYVNVQVFGGLASSGSFTWNKPSGAKTVEVLMMSGGGGGGSGARQASTAGRFGGGGGGGAGGISFKLDADALGSSETVTVGAGGAGGTAVAADSTNGNPGTKGGDSVFGPITCRGGNFGGGGTDTTGAAGATSLWYQWISNLVTLNNRGGVAPAAAPGIVYDHFYSSTGGGGGASRLANVTLPSGGGAGGNKLAATGGVESGLTSAIVGGAGGLGGTSTPPVAGTNGTEYWGGTGGGGGYYRPSTVGNPGAAGGWPGGGGGGGGCSDNSFNSGAGGAGGNGVVVVITYCS